MLLDVSALKQMLTKMVEIGAEGPAQPSATFLKLLAKGVGKIDQLLKVVSRHTDPPEGLVETYVTLFGNDCNIVNLQKILELKVYSLAFNLLGC